MRYVFLCGLQVGLLAERVDAIYLAVAWRRCREVSLDVAVASLGACRRHAEGDDGVCLGSELQARRDDTAELLHVGNEVVARCDYYISLRIDSLDAPCDVCYTWRRVATAWLKKDVLGRHFRKLLAHQCCVLLVRHHPNILKRTDSLESVVCKLQKGSAYSEDINKLFRIVFCAHRPETTSYSTSHDYQVISILSHIIKSFRYAKINIFYHFLK